MAHFVDQYVHYIKQCEDYNLLSNEIDLCISKNILNSVSMDIKEAIDRLGLDTPYHKFVKTMVWASAVSDHTETSLNILRYFCNKVVKEFDSMTLEPDEYSLMIFAICADDKQFINKLTDDRKLELINTLCRWYLCTTDADKNNPDLDAYLKTSMELILQGKTMQELDWEFREKYSVIKPEADYTGKVHEINEIGRPFQALFINIMQNLDQQNLLYQISLSEWRDRIDEEIHHKARLYKEKFGMKNAYESCCVFLTEFISLCKDLNDDLTNTGYTNIENRVVGRFIWGFLGALHYNYSEHDFSAKEIVLLLRDGWRIFNNSFAVNESARIIILNVIDRYCDSGEYEDSLLKDEYFEAIKAYLKQDELFNIWYSEFHDNTKYAINDRIYATYIHSYMNPMLDSADTLLKSKENDLDVEFIPKAEVVAATEAKSTQWKMDDEDQKDDDNDNEDQKDTENDDQEDNDMNNDEEEYEGPEIEAKQSTKGYKKGSKVQADSERKIYGAYKKYKNNEAKVDSQLAKMLGAAKKAFSQDKTEEIIEGKKFTPIGLLKKILITAAIFNYSKVAGFVYLLVSHTVSKKRTLKAKREILMQLETEIKMMDEKIEDARGDGNRKAKYALMRTKAELVRARDKIRYNLSASKNDMKKAKSYLDNDSRDNLDNL